MSAITPALPTISLNPPIAALNLRSATSHLILSTHRRRRLYPPLRVANDSKATEVSPDRITGNSEADKIVDGMEFGELCNEFECISSPSVEATARQLVRDILELREGNRALGTYAVSVKYKDPVRSFTGREKYKRPLWSSVALDKPTVSVQDMSMLSTSLLNIKWTLKGNPKNPLVRVGGPVILKVNARFTLNQISGQVIEHEELWDLSSSSTIAQAYFWASRRLFSTTEAAKDISDSVKNLSSRFSTKKENTGIYPDPTDPTKFFQSNNDFQRDAYQLALFLALIYFLVQFLRTTL
ncbi:uncharacterized protein LOC112509661 [Cynara cardunculus var. scolymus]|uniref:uncharacterized protein LOC112509661 n=1 Tax=Cynara cardunculus var. scolymus TaxID=59895 RepID=UPI000D623FC3|nr:uncharacterized protein LOC112509661 [Cynara cardunculus var. scolymus]